jgi:hypothetical protein
LRPSCEGFTAFFPVSRWAIFRLKAMEYALVIKLSLGSKDQRKYDGSVVRKLPEWSAERSPIIPGIA